MTITTVVSLASRRAATPPEAPTPAHVAAIENALTMALHFIRQPMCTANLWAATSRATRAATLLKIACEGRRPDIAPRDPYAPVVAILRRIVTETMAYPPQRPHSADSFLPADLVDQAQNALALYGARVTPAAEVSHG